MANLLARAIARGRTRARELRYGPATYTKEVEERMRKRAQRAKRTAAAKRLRMPVLSSALADIMLEGDRRPKKKKEKKKRPDYTTIRTKAIKRAGVEILSDEEKYRRGIR